MMSETHSDYRATNRAFGREFIEMDDPWLLNFGCNGTRELEQLVVLPYEQAVFDENFVQKEHIEIRDKRFTRQLQDFIQLHNQKLEKYLIKGAKEEADIKHNKRLYNKKSDGIVSMLREHFKELRLTENQHDWLGGKLKLKFGGYRFTLPIYSKEKRTARHR